MADDLTPGFETRLPTHQNALDIFSGSWGSAFPPSSGLVGGSGVHFDDVRVTWAANVLGGLAGRSILELGPYEAYNTYQFEQAGAASVTAIEGSRVNFFKCLIVKNIFGLNATFLYGDFEKYLYETSSRFDICWASGVLYHVTQPIELLQAIKRVADTAFVWSHYYEHDMIVGSDNAYFFDPAKDVVATAFDRSIRLHHRNYHQDDRSFFSGGEASYSYWMEKEDILFLLRRLGYGRIDMGIDNPRHPPGPAFFLLARV